MSACVQYPTLTLFSTVTSTTVVTTFSAIVQTVQGTASTFTTASCLSIVAGYCVSSIVNTGAAAIPGGFSTILVPITITNTVVEVNPTATLFASCSPLSTTGIGSPGQNPSQSSSLPASTILSVTTTPSPIVVTQELSTSYNGVASVVTVTSTSTPPPSVVPVVTAAGPSKTSTSASHSPNDAAPIAGGALGGFFFLVGVVTVVWYIMKKCRKPRENVEEEDLLFPYPVTRDRDRTHRLDLAHEPRPYVYGLVGSTTADIVTTPRNSMSHSRTASDGRLDSTTVLIGTSSPGLVMPVASASTGNVAAAHGAQVRNGEVERQTPQSSTSQLPPGAAPPVDPFRPSGGGNRMSTGTSWFPLQPLKPSISPAPTRSIPGPAPNTSSSHSKPLPIIPVLERQPGRPQGTPTQNISSSSGDAFIHTNWGRQQAPDHSPRKKQLPPPRVTTDAPPAYVA